jgi:plasmid stabilization system protein ParE
MAKRFSLSFAESAVSDLEDILAYFRKQDSPDAGMRLVEEILAQTERLPLFPDSGRVVPEFGLEQLREIIHPPFRIVYRREKNKIRIVRIWRSERLLKVP